MREILVGRTEAAVTFGKMLCRTLSSKDFIRTFLKTCIESSLITTRRVPSAVSYCTTLINWCFLSTLRLPVVVAGKEMKMALTKMEHQTPTRTFSRSTKPRRERAEAIETFRPITIISSS